MINAMWMCEVNATIPWNNFHFKSYYQAVQMLVVPVTSVDKVVKMESVYPSIYSFDSGPEEDPILGNITAREIMSQDDRLTEVASRLRIIGDQLDKDYFQNENQEFPGFLRCLLRTWRLSRQVSDSVDTLLNIYLSVFTNSPFVQRRNELRSNRTRRRAYSESEV